MPVGRWMAADSDEERNRCLMQYSFFFFVEFKQQCDHQRDVAFRQHFGQDFDFRKTDEDGVGTNPVDAAMGFPKFQVENALR